MKKGITSIILSIFFVGITQEVLATEEMNIQIFENNELTTKKAVTVKYYFKSIPPLKYKGKIRIDYYPYDRGYTGVYL